MKTLFAAALAIFIAIPSFAASTKKSKPKPRDLKALIHIAMTDGRERQAVPHLIAELEISSESLSNGHLPMRSFSYEQATSPDNQKHVFSVAYKADELKSPLFILLDVFSGRKEGGVTYADGYTLQLDLNGSIIKAVSVRGVLKHATRLLLDPTSPEATQALAHEMAFYSNDSLKLEMTTK